MRKSPNRKSPIRFAKYDASGNTFVAMEWPGQERIDRYRHGRIAEILCGSVAGVCADGLLVISPAEKADFRLDIFNSDGSWAERSGNGLRCAVAHQVRRQLRRSSWRIETNNTVVEATVHARPASKVVGHWNIESELGVPVVLNNKTDRRGLYAAQVSGRLVKFVEVAIGNPHVVIPCAAFPKNWRDIGAALSTNKRFFRGTNVEFIKKINRRAVAALVWERGVGETESSGTGSAAAMVAARTLGWVDDKITVRWPRHTISCTWRGPEETISIAGPVRLVMTGEIVI